LTNLSWRWAFYANAALLFPVLISVIVWPSEFIYVKEFKMVKIATKAEVSGMDSSSMSVEAI